MADTNDASVTKAVRPGDLLLAIDGFDVAGRPLAGVVDALREKEGDARTLVLSRGGEVLSVRAPIVSVV